MKLHYAPGACSIVSHIALEEAGADYETARVDFAKGENRTEAYRRLHPQGKVPALETEAGVLTENVAILQYIGDRFGKPGAVPTGDAFARARATELLGWCASTVHISFGMLFRPQRFGGEIEATREAAVQRLTTHFGRIERMCAGDDWLVGGQFSAADSYMACFFRWAKRSGFKLDKCAHWAGHVERVIAREAVARVIADEALEPGEFRP